MPAKTTAWRIRQLKKSKTNVFKHQISNENRKLQQITVNNF